MSSKNKYIFLKLLKSFLAVFIGSIFGLIILELSLRGLGYYIKNQNDLSNLKTRQSDELRILALGDSVTNSGVEPYPEQLQKILSKTPALSGKVKVINGGIPSTSSKDIVENLESYIDKYNPNIVIVMTGINNDRIVDYDKWAKIDNNSGLNNIKTYRLFKYLYQNFQNKIKNKITKVGIIDVYASETYVDDILQYIKKNNANGIEKDFYKEEGPESLDDKNSYYENQLKKELKSSKNKDLVYMKLQEYYSGQGRLKESIDCSLNAISVNPNSSDAYQKLSDIHALPPGYRSRLAIKAIESNIYDPYGYSALAEIYKSEGNLEKSIKVYEDGIKVIPDSFHLLYQLGIINYNLGNYDKAEKEFLESLKYMKDEEGKKPDAYELLAKIYQKQNRHYEAQRVMGLAIESSNILANNYPIIARTLKEKGIKLIAMQYPLRDINILKNILKGYDVSYVDNKESFEEVLKYVDKEKIFVDLFAGDFGHCTPEGNRIIAENVAKEILKMYPPNK